MEKQKLPNATIALVLGICSILTCCCYGVIGLPLGITALILGNKAIKLNNENLNEYEGVNNATAGKVLGIIGIILNLVFIGYLVWILSLIGWDALGDAELMMERAKELQNR
ncbi:CCC motif membrane protein [Tenacibaculum ovolyticum]|jgi:hypothetical protein|uniref:CCC motif membrane protein n=1 Tax=Tenacibaculum ovolyticum TaxID=104270 RepID=UPI003BA91495